MSGLRWDGAPAPSVRLAPPRRRRKRWLWLLALLPLAPAAGLGWWYFSRDTVAADPPIEVDYAALLAGRDANQGWRALAKDRSLVISLFIGRDPDSTREVAPLVLPGTRAVSYFVWYFQTKGQSAEIHLDSMELLYVLAGKPGAVEPAAFTSGMRALPARLDGGESAIWTVTFVVPAGAVVQELVVEAPWSVPQSPVRYVFVRPP